MRRLLPLLLALLGCNFPRVNLVPVPASESEVDGSPVGRQERADLAVSVRYLGWSYGGLEFRVEVTNRSRTPVLVAPEEIECRLRSAKRPPRAARPLDPHRPGNHLQAAEALKKHTLISGETLRGTVTFDLTTLEDARYRDIRVILQLGSEAFTFDFGRSTGPVASVR
ncbi:MAG: hypothetical protein Q8K67_12805 [Geothrix sp.]|nr:hypothetical protein [Geothrix sp.]